MGEPSNVTGEEANPLILEVDCESDVIDVEKIQNEDSSSGHFVECIISGSTHLINENNPKNSESSTESSDSDSSSDESTDSNDEHQDKKASHNTKVYDPSEKHLVKDEISHTQHLKDDDESNDETDNIDCVLKQHLSYVDGIDSINHDDKYILPVSSTEASNHYTGLLSDVKSMIQDMPRSKLEKICFSKILLEIETKTKLQNVGKEYNKLYKFTETLRAEYDKVYNLLTSLRSELQTCKEENKKLTALSSKTVQQAQNLKQEQIPVISIPQVKTQKVAKLNIQSPIKRPIRIIPKKNPSTLRQLTTTSSPKVPVNDETSNTTVSPNLFCSYKIVSRKVGTENVIKIIPVEKSPNSSNIDLSNHIQVRNSQNINSAISAYIKNLPGFSPNSSFQIQPVGNVSSSQTPTNTFEEVSILEPSNKKPSITLNTTKFSDVSKNITISKSNGSLINDKASTALQQTTEANSDSFLDVRSDNRLVEEATNNKRKSNSLFESGNPKRKLVSGVQQNDSIAEAFSDSLFPHIISTVSLANNARRPNPNNIIRPFKLQSLTNKSVESNANVKASCGNLTINSCNSNKPLLNMNSKAQLVIPANSLNSNENEHLSSEITKVNLLNGINFSKNIALQSITSGDNSAPQKSTLLMQKPNNPAPQKSNLILQKPNNPALQKSNLLLQKLNSPALQKSDLLLRKPNDPVPQKSNLLLQKPNDPAPQKSNLLLPKPHDPTPQKSNLLLQKPSNPALQKPNDPASQKSNLLLQKSDNATLQKGELLLQKQSKDTLGKKNVQSTEASIVNIDLTNDEQNDSRTLEKLQGEIETQINIALKKGKLSDGVSLYLDVDGVKKVITCSNINMKSVENLKKAEWKANPSAVVKLFAKAIIQKVSTIVGTTAPSKVVIRKCDLLDACKK